MRRRRCVWILLAALTACASHMEVPGGTFVDAPPVGVVNDRKDVPRPPRARAQVANLGHLDGLFLDPLRRALAVPRNDRALGVNAIDEVPDSTWYTNRGPLSADQIRRGATVVGTPEDHRPWTILGSKVGGASIGFIIADARGEKFLLKFDPAGFAELETATGVIVNRLIWASGYNVPEEHVVYFRRDDLRLAPDATIKAGGDVRPLTQAELDQRLARVAIDADGRIRGIASKHLTGKLLGGHPARGVRPDDPNDRIPHELRRDLRGARSIFSWLDHVDAKEGNTLDVWVADPKNEHVHYVVHYLIDFGKSLGAMAMIHRNLRSGYEYSYDFWATLGSLLSAGARERAWEHRRVPRLRGIGLFDAATFDPGGWKPNTPSYLPFRTADRFDQFWGAKRVISFSREQLQAAVDAGRLTDPRAATYLVETLAARQRATARYWFSRVSPLDRFELVTTATGKRLCFDDLALVYGLEDVRSTRYVLETQNHEGRTVGQEHLLRPAGARSCSRDLAIEGYTVVRLETRRPRTNLITYVHLTPARVIGVWRE